MNPATQATEPTLRLVSSPLLSAAEKSQEVAARWTAIQWAVLIHLFLIATWTLIKLPPSGQFEDYLTIDPIWDGGTTICCPVPKSWIQKPIISPLTPPSAAPPGPEAAALPSIEVTAVDPQISLRLNSVTYDALHRGDRQLETSMFAPTTRPSASRRISLPPPFASLPAIPSMLLFSPVAIPGPTAVAGALNQWTLRRRTIFSPPTR